VFALLLFATMMGHVASIVANLSNARKDFQGRQDEQASIDNHGYILLAKLDAVKTYMSLRRVPNNLEDRVIRWLVSNSLRSTMTTILLSHVQTIVFSSHS
jgi:cyclic nucleotide gated channel alpha 3